MTRPNLHNKCDRNSNNRSFNFEMAPNIGRRRRKLQITGNLLADFTNCRFTVWISLILASSSLWNGSFAQIFDGSSVLVGKNITYKFNGTQKLPQCLSNVCLNGGTCYVIQGDFDCTCAPGFTGTLCEVPLSSEDVCNPKCPPQAQCVKNQCVCPSGTELFQGTCRGILTDPCSSIQCLNNGTCLEENTPGGGQRVSCKCPAGFRGTRCELIVPASSLEPNPCRATRCPNGQKCISRKHLFICVPDSTTDPSIPIIDQTVTINLSTKGIDNENSLVISQVFNNQSSIIEEPLNSETNSMCNERPCFNGGTCAESPVAPGFQCICRSGWAGQRCQMDVKECRTHPCLNGATCQETAGGFNCLCKAGYGGKLCEENNNDCLFNPCRHGGTCVDGIDDFTCICPDNWSGKTCETLFNACESSPCKNEGGCSTLPPSKEFSCTCPAGFAGDFCEVNTDSCDGVVCPEPGHVCVEQDGGHECRCPDGLQGAACRDNINECNNRTGLCQNGATCLDDHGGYRCLCRTGYTGNHCEFAVDICGTQNNPCQNNGSCQKNMLGYDCICPTGTSGRHCEVLTTRDPCISNPCQTGTQCARTSFGQGYQCIVAVPNLDERNSEEEEDVCEEVVCLNNGTCTPSTDGVSYQCQCHPGFRGIHCEEDIADCFPNNPCFNGGSCLEKSNRTIYDLGLISGSFDYSNASGYLCLCPAGLGGQNCGESKSTCEPNPCENRGQCVPTPPAGFQCVCAPGFTGRNCDSDIDECSQGLMTGTQGPCVNAVQCLNTPGSFRCECQLGWGGPRCDTQLLGCFKSPCSGNATCQPYLTPQGQHGFECVCPGGRAGSDCELDTVAGFSGRSLIAYVTNPPPDNYTLSAQFRTTLDNVLLLSGDDILGTTVFTLELASGNLKLSWMDQPILLENLHRSLHDGDWKKVKLSKYGERIELAILDSFSGLELMQETLIVAEQGLNVFSTKFGRTSNQRALGMDISDFVGCMRDMRINGEQLVPARLARSSANVQLSCERVPQCAGNPCNAHGTCMDKWSTYECACKRPYLPPDCSFAFSEATFGFEGNRSYAHVTMSIQEKESLELETDISMLVRTRALNGGLLYLGSETNANPELDTFVTLQLHEGQLRANTKLGGRDILPFVGGPKLNDGLVHTVGFKRMENTVQGFVDGDMVFQGKLRHPFPHPLLASHFYIGGYPLPFPNDTGDAGLPTKRGKRQTASSLQRVVVLNPRAFDTAKSFKGTIQDVRINGMHIVFFPPISAVNNVRRFGRVVLYNNVLNGTVSDDMCRESPCENGAGCLVTFNDYECQCVDGWRGKNCTKVDHCFNSEICPPESKCTNTDTGYLCLAPGTFNKGSSAQFILQNPSSQNRSMFYTLSFKIRTRDQSGIIFYSSSPDQNFLLLEIKNGDLDLVYRLGQTEIVRDLSVTRNLNVTDGKWHQIKLTLLTEQSYVNIDGNQTALYLTGRPTVPMSDIFLSGTPLFVGSVPRDLVSIVPDRFSTGNSDSFKGCLNDVIFGEIPPLTFYEKSLYGNPDTTHFVPFDLNGVAVNCHGEAQCGPDGLRGPCQNGASCRDLWNARQCDCVPGFRGLLCEENIDDCVGHQCDTKFGECMDGVQNYTCACTPGYGGRFCEYEIDECESSPCINGGTCLNLLDKFECVCNANYTGNMCEVLITIDCDSSPCQNGASCVDWIIPPDRRSFNCSCMPGYEGKTCESEIDYCEPAPCKNGASCRSMTNRQDYLCNCALGYTGKDCDIEINECESNPCQNEGECLDGVANFTCVCKAGWEGPVCLNDVDECATSAPCASWATCVNTAGNYSCQCPQYYLGNSCEIEGSCLAGPCAHGNCTQLSADQHVCACQFGYEGEACDREIDYCASVPCLMNGTCNRLLGGFQCSCIPGLMGPTCGEDIKECDSNPCEQGSCTDLLNGFRCNCNPGFQGKTCNEDIDECGIQGNCVRGTCKNLPGTFECLCNAGYLGSRCSHKNPCRMSADNITTTTPGEYNWGHRCKNRARCMVDTTQVLEDSEEVHYQCECAEHFSGTYCELPGRQVQNGPRNLAYIIGPILGIIILFCIVGCIGFVMVARKKRATRGHYSPSRQEMTGARVQMGPMIKPPPEERLI